VAGHYYRTEAHLRKKEKVKPTDFVGGSHAWLSPFAHLPISNAAQIDGFAHADCVLDANPAICALVSVIGA
jgi:hypothetical protein